MSDLTDYPTPQKFPPASQVPDSQAANSSSKAASPLSKAATPSSKATIPSSKIPGAAETPSITKQHASQQDKAPTPEGAHALTRDTHVAPTPYVRPRKPHRTQSAIDDLAQDNLIETSGGYTHDSNITVRGHRPFSGRPYRRSQADMNKLKQGSQYGQYLQIPKGKRSIFVSRERVHRRNSVIIAVCIAVVLLLVLAFAIHLILSSVR